MSLTKPVNKYTLIMKQIRYAHPTLLLLIYQRPRPFQSVVCVCVRRTYMRSYRKRRVEKEIELSSARNLLFQERKTYRDLEGVEK